MRRPLCRIVFGVSALALFALASRGQAAKPDDTIRAAVMSHAYDLTRNGRDFLLFEAKSADYFLLGELHGDNEIPQFIHEIWPEMWKRDYLHIAAEISPWTAHQLETGPPGTAADIQGLWTRKQAVDVHRFASPKTAVLWGCDMEEIHPEFLIEELARLNPSNTSVPQMNDITKDGYRRDVAARLLLLLHKGKISQDEIVNDISLQQNLAATLEIDLNRSNPESKMSAQNEREILMKTQFLVHLRMQKPNSKLFLRFGRNHLHRGYDARGVSTLGNFIVEFGLSQNQKTFNVGAFGAGGQATLMGETFSADERGDELAFDYLAQQAKYPATVFDLRPLRPLLHAIPQEKRSPLEVNLLYWADAYDALICYKNVTPLQN